MTVLWSRADVTSLSFAYKYKHFFPLWAWVLFLTGFRGLSTLFYTWIEPVHLLNVIRSSPGISKNYIHNTCKLYLFVIKLHWIQMKHLCRLYKTTTQRKYLFYNSYFHSRLSSWRQTKLESHFLFSSPCTTSSGIWNQPGGLRQLHHERHNPVGWPSVSSPGGRGAAGAADKEQWPHATSLCAAGR